MKARGHVEPDHMERVIVRIFSCILNKKPMEKFGAEE